MEEGFLDLEEVEGVEVVYEGLDGEEGGGGGKVVKFRVREREENEGQEVIDVDVDELDLDVDMEGEEDEEDEEGEYDLPPDEEELLITGPELPGSEENEDMEVVEEGPDNLDEENEVEEVKQVEAFDGMFFFRIPHSFSFSRSFFRIREGATFHYRLLWLTISSERTSVYGSACSNIYNPCLVLLRTWSSAATNEQSTTLRSLRLYFCPFLRTLVFSWLLFIISCS